VAYETWSVLTATYTYVSEQAASITISIAHKVQQCASLARPSIMSHSSVRARAHRWRAAKDEAASIHRSTGAPLQQSDCAREQHAQVCECAVSASVADRYKLRQMRSALAPPTLESFDILRHQRKLSTRFSFSERGPRGGGPIGLKPWRICSAGCSLLPTGRVSTPWGTLRTHTGTLSPHTGYSEYATARPQAAAGSRAHCGRPRCHVCRGTGLRARLGCRCMRGCSRWTRRMHRVRCCHAWAGSGWAASHIHLY
jgi:hypothetical protein